jgi:hypothetical protein
MMRSMSRSREQRAGGIVGHREPDEGRLVARDRLEHRIDVERQVLAQRARRRSEIGEVGLHSIKHERRIGGEDHGTGLGDDRRQHLQDFVGPVAEHQADIGRQRQRLAAARPSLRRHCHRDTG